MITRWSSVHIMHKRTWLVAWIFRLFWMYRCWWVNSAITIVFVIESVRAAGWRLIVLFSVSFWYSSSSVGFAPAINTFVFIISALFDSALSVHDRVDASFLCFVCDAKKFTEVSSDYVYSNLQYWQSVWITNVEYTTQQSLAFAQPNKTTSKQQHYAHEQHTQQRVLHKRQPNPITPALSNKPAFSQPSPSNHNQHQNSDHHQHQPAPILTITACKQNQQSANSHKTHHQQKPHCVANRII